MTAPADDITPEEIAAIAARYAVAEEQPFVTYAERVHASLSDIPRLLAALRRREEELAEVREMFEFALKHRDDDIRVSTEIADYERDAAIALLARAEAALRKVNALLGRPLPEIDDHRPFHMHTITALLAEIEAEHGE